MHPDPAHAGRRPRLPRPFHLLLGASAATNLADGVRAVALPLLATELTTAPLAIAVLATAQYTPALVVGLPAGVLADRLDRRRLAVTADLVQAAAFALVAVAAATGKATIGLLYLVALVVGTAETIGDTAMATAVPALVPDRQLEQANGRVVTVVFTGQQLVGPAVGGALFALAVTSPFTISAALAALSAAAVARLPTLNRTRLPAGHESAAGVHHRTRALLVDVRVGVGFLARHRLLRTVALVAVVLSLTDAAWFAVLVLLVTDELGAPPVAYGVVLAIAALGGIAGGLAADRIIARTGAAAVLRGGLVVIGGSQIVLGVASSVVVATAALAAGNVGFAVWHTAAATLRHAVTPDEVLGRLTAAWRTVSIGAVPIGAALGGLVAALLGLRAPFLLGAPLVLLTAVLARPITARAVRASRRPMAARGDDP